MVENILIQFDADTEGITTAEAAVKHMGSASAAEFAKMNQALKQSDAQWKSVNTNLDRYTDKIKKASEAAAGVFGTKGLQQLDKEVTKVTHSIETLRAKMLIKQQALIESTDINKIIQYNKEIQALQAQITRLKNSGAAGFDDLGNAIAKTEVKANLLQRSFSFLSKAAYFIPGLGIAGILNLAGEAIADLVKKLFQGKEATEKFALSQKDLGEALEESDYKKAVENVNELKINIDLAKKGFLDKEKVLHQYNDTIGETTGQVKTLDEAELALVKNGDAYIKMMLYKAAANIALGEAAKKAVEAEQIRLKDDKKEASFFDNIKGLFGAKTEGATAQAKEYEAALKKYGAQRKAADIKAAEDIQKNQVKIASDFQKKAAEIAKGFKFDFFGGEEDGKTVRHVKDISDVIKDLRKELSTLANEETIGIITPTQADLDRVKAYEKAFKGVFDLGGNAATPIVKQLAIELSPINQRVLERQVRDLIAKLPNIADKLIAPSDNSTTLREAVVKMATAAMQKFTDNASVLYTQDLANEKARLDAGEIDHEEYYRRLDFLKNQYNDSQLSNQIALNEGLIASLQAQGFETVDLERKTNDLKQQQYQNDVRNKSDAEKKKTALEQEEAEKRQQIIEAATDFGYSLMTGYFENLNASYQSDLANVQKLQDMKLITEQEAHKRIKAIRRQQAAADKQQAIFNIAIQTAQNIVKYFKNPIALALAIAAGLTQTAFVASRKIPEFRKGGFTGKKKVDEVAGIVHGQEFVAHAEATRKYQPALEAINALKFEEYLFKHAPKDFKMPEMNFPKFELLTMSRIPDSAMRSFSSSSIDNDKLADAIATKIVQKQGHLKDITGVELNISKDGIYIAARNGIDRMEFLNRKYKYKG